MESRNNQTNEIRAKNSPLVNDWGPPLAREFERGQWVAYLPPHASGELNHIDVDYGVVSGKTDKLVHVRFLDGRVLQRANSSHSLKSLLLYPKGFPEEMREGMVLEDRHLSVCGALFAHHTYDERREFDFSDVTGKACKPKHLHKIQAMGHVEIILSQTSLDL